VLDGRQLALKVLAISLLMATPEIPSILEHLWRQNVLLFILSSLE